MTKAHRPIRIDFHNADPEGFVRLNTVGCIEDLSVSGLILQSGLRVEVTDGEIVVDGLVHPPGAEGVWRLQVDWDEVFRRHAAAGVPQLSPQSN